MNPNVGSRCLYGIKSIPKIITQVLLLHVALYTYAADTAAFSIISIIRLCWIIVFMLAEHTASQAGQIASQVTIGGGWRLPLEVKSDVAV